MNPTAAAARRAARNLENSAEQAKAMGAVEMLRMARSAALALWRLADELEKAKE